MRPASRCGRLYSRSVDLRGILEALQSSCQPSRQ